MKSRHIPITLPLIALIVTAALCAGCSDDEKDTITNTDTSNHTIALTNNGTNTVECVARQFVRLELVPASEPSSTITETFVSNPNSTIDVELTIPGTDDYKMTFYIAGIDSCIWWDSIALEVDGTTDVILCTNNMGFYDNSYVAGIRSSGDNIPCD